MFKNYKKEPSLFLSLSIVIVPYDLCSVNMQVGFKKYRMAQQNNFYFWWWLKTQLYKLLLLQKDNPKNLYGSDSATFAASFFTDLHKDMNLLPLVINVAHFMIIKENQVLLL